MLTVENHQLANLSSFCQRNTKTDHLFATYFITIPPSTHLKPLEHESGCSFSSLFDFNGRWKCVIQSCDGGLDIMHYIFK